MDSKRNTSNKITESTWPGICTSHNNETPSTDMRVLAVSDNEFKANNS